MSASPASQAGGVGSSYEAQIFKDSGFEGIVRARCLENSVEKSRYAAICPHHLWNAWLRTATHEGVAQFAHYTLDCRAVYVWVRAVEIAKGFLQTAMAGFEDEPRVAGRIEFLPGDGHSQFAWHIEARRLRGGADLFQCEIGHELNIDSSE